MGIPVTGDTEPYSYSEAVQDERWIVAMKDELKALESNKAWDLRTLPKEKKAIGSKWVFRIKRNEDGSIHKFKARLFAKGYLQKPGQDFGDCFAPVTRSVTIRLLLVVALVRGWRIHQFDINNAFLHGTLEEELYLRPPPGYSVPPGQVCRLRKSLYGLKQAPRVWYTTLTEKILAMGFHKSSHDHCLFVRIQEEVKAQLHSAFTIKDLGDVNFFLGIEVSNDGDDLVLSQRQYIFVILEDFNRLDSRGVSTPFPAGLSLSSQVGEPFPNPTRFRRLVGRLLYLNFSRPDITFATQQLSQFLDKPLVPHWKAALHLLKYLKGSLDLCLIFTKDSSFQLQAYSDADWGTCPDSRKSITGYSIYLGKNLISWKSKKQSTVSVSSTEAEYRSKCTTTCELLWISYLLEALNLPVLRPIPLFCDNQSALHIAQNPVFHERTKHIKIDCHLVRHHFLFGFIHPTPIRSRFQIADIFTKALPGPLFTCLRSKLHVHSLGLRRGCQIEEMQQDEGEKKSLKHQANGV